MLLPNKTIKKKNILPVIALAVSTAMSSGTACANETAPVPEYTLDQVLVTAQRYETRDVNTPASTSIHTYEQLQATGAKNLLEALKLVEGVVYGTYGPSGTSQGTMTSKVIIRGVESGTLVLLNGSPINLRGFYNLEDIPLETVERVEIIKGGGSVLYGSEATGGVINIITKKSRENSFSVSGGNFGQQDHNLNLQIGKLGVGYGYEKWGNTGKISSYVTSGKEMYNVFDGLERNNHSWTYDFDDSLSLLYNHSDSKSRYNYTFGSGYAASLQNQLRKTTVYEDNKDFVQLQYRHDHIKGNVYYNYKTLRTLTDEFYSPPGSHSDKTEKNRTYGFDLQQDWQVKNNTLLLGLSGQNEYFKPDIKQTLDFKRNIYSLYGQWEHPVNAADTMILSARETWTAGAPNDRNYTNFSGQGQYLHKLNEKESLYTSIGQSFKMPTFSQIYGSGSSLMVGNPYVKPQTGMHYETGWKKNSGTHQWRAALFHYYIKDNIESKKIDNDQYQYTNKDLKNTGVELACNIAGTNGWNFNWGISYGNPLSKGTDKPYWDRVYGRWQLNGGATYQHDRWQATLTGNYLAKRVGTPSSAHSYEQKPYLLTSLHVKYALDKNRDLFFTANNILDREDLVQHSSADYYYTPFNFTLGYKSKF